jgi:hypothetical protein
MHVWYTADTCPASLLVLAFALADEFQLRRVLLLDSSPVTIELLLLLLLHWMSVSGQADIWSVVFTLHPRPKSRREIKARSRDAQASVDGDLLINYIKKSPKLAQ